MDPQDIEFFRNHLREMLDEIYQKGKDTIDDMSESSELFADPADRASHESDQSFTLRLRDRERRLIKKIHEAIERIEDGSFGQCEECGGEIGTPRLKARPVTTLCIQCKSRQEDEEKLRG